MATCNQSTRNTSNIVQTKISRAQISNRDNGLAKSTDKPYASVGETMTYTIVLKNTGNTAADNIVFIDTIPTGLGFVTNSVMLNGATIPGISPELPGGVTLATLLPGNVATISFKTTVNSLPVVSQANNVGEVSYNYTVDPSLPNGSSSNNPTNVVTSTIANASLD
ncbi:DUF11 domain-containing protein, partial [Romboutsia sp.]|uniref:DUF11 domain-containing protein n=1 Tax=Romboutsia sp. TaxID=1965302 RepID=UPI003F3857B6